MRVSGRRPRNDRLRLTIAFVTLLAFTLQALVVQTHIHGLVGVGAAHVLDKIALQKLPQGRLPANDDPANCAACQGILHAGIYVMPSAAVLLLPTIAASVSFIVTEVATIIQVYSHGWNSRAPPLA